MNDTPKDHNGRTIELGAVLMNTRDGERGVVVQIGKPGELAPLGMAVGDLRIKINRHTDRITNIYHEWRHLERRDQTAIERITSFIARPWEYEESETRSRDEQFAMEMAAALLPFDPWDDEYDWPTSVDEILCMVAEHVDELRRALNKRS